MTAIHAPQLPEPAIRARARTGPRAVFPDVEGYGHILFGGVPQQNAADGLDAARIVPPVFVPGRLERMFDLGREPLYSDVELTTRIGGFTSALPVFVCAFGSTAAAGGDLGAAASRQAGRLGIPMVIGENVVPMRGYGRLSEEPAAGLLHRIRAYAEAAGAGLGGVVVQQSTEDADAEVWNLVYSDPFATSLLDQGRLAFELKVGQGAKPGLGGMTVLSRADAEAVSKRYLLDDVFGAEAGIVLRSSSPGTFTPEILRHQVRLMRNNYPRARVWVKLHPGRDVAEAAAVAWAAGADAVTVDGAEGGTGWAPGVFLDHVGLPLAECLRRIGSRRTGPEADAADLLVSGRIWEGARALKCLALGAAAVGLGRAALLAVDEDPAEGLVRLTRCLELELRLLLSALGRYRVADLTPDDVWFPQARDDGDRTDGTRSDSARPDVARSGGTRDDGIRGGGARAETADTALAVGHDERSHAMVSDQKNAAKTFVEIELSDEVRDRIGAALLELPDPVTDIDRSLTRLRVIFTLLPIEQLQEILDFGRHVDTPGVALVRNLPTDPQLPPTPTDGGPSRDKRTFVAEGVLLGLSQLLGEPVGFTTEKAGRLIHDVVPVASGARTQTNQSSEVFLNFHNDIVHDDIGRYDVANPDFLVLNCLRQDRDKQARTYYADARDISRRLPPKTLEILRTPLFRLNAPGSYVRDVAGGADVFSDEVAVISGPEHAPEIVVSANGVRGLTPEADQALADLQQTCTAVAHQVLLEPGTALLINNRKGLHARSVFAAQHDGYDRWLQRTYLRRSLWNIRYRGKPGDRRVH